MKSLRLPMLLGVAHGVADGASGLLLGLLPTHMPLAQTGALVMLYNVLAFACQPLYGYLSDRLNRPRWFAISGLALVALAMLIAPMQPVVAVFIAGFGSGAFHVGGGALAFTAAEGKSNGAGLFASPGVLGLAIGGALAATSQWHFGLFAVALLVLMGLVWTNKTSRLQPAHVPAQSHFDQHDAIMIALLAGIALRSAVWTTLDALMHARVDLLLMMGAAAFVGKLAGGFLAERIGWRTWTIGALLASAALLTFAMQNVMALLLGVALLQSATPAALAATMRLLPRYPATGAGLALGLAIAIGGLPVYTGMALQLPAPLIFAGGAVVAALAVGWSLKHMRLPRGALTPSK